MRRWNSVLKRSGSVRRWNSSYQPSKSARLPRTSNVEHGNAIVEFIGVIVLLVAPVLVVLSALATLASAQFALSQAGSEAARVFVRSASFTSGEHAALVQANEVWHDRGFNEVLDLSVECRQSPCMAAGGEVTIRLEASVHIPIVGIMLPLSDSQDASIDQWRSL